MPPFPHLLSPHAQVSFSDGSCLPVRMRLLVAPKSGGPFTPVCADLQLHAHDHVLLLSAAPGVLSSANGDRARFVKLVRPRLFFCQTWYTSIKNGTVPGFLLLTYCYC